LGPSLGAIDVSVKSKVDAQVPSDEHPDESNTQQGKTVFLHLKKFFRGARFTNSWFLNKMAAKYPLYAQVAVGGKVSFQIFFVNERVSAWRTVLSFSFSV
jgi:hypothetical protein